MRSTCRKFSTCLGTLHLDPALPRLSRYLKCRLWAAGAASLKVTANGGEEGGWMTVSMTRSLGLTSVMSEPVEVLPLAFGAGSAGVEPSRVRPGRGSDRGTRRKGEEALRGDGAEWRRERAAVELASCRLRLASSRPSASERVERLFSISSFPLPPTPSPPLSAVSALTPRPLLSSSVIRFSVSDVPSSLSRFGPPSARSPF